MANSALATPTFQAVNSNIANDGTADSPRGWATNTDANYTFIVTSHSRAEIKNPTAARTATLPSTGVKAGKQYELLVSGATETNYVALQSSGENEIDRIGGEGRILVQATKDDPTAAADWKVVDVEENNVLKTGTPTGANTNTITARMSRRNKSAEVYMAQSSATATAVNTIMLTSFLPTRFRPSRGQRCGTALVEANATKSATVVSESNGTVTFILYNAAAFSTSGVCYVESTFSYRLD